MIVCFTAAYQSMLIESAACLYVDNSRVDLGGWLATYLPIPISTGLDQQSTDSRRLSGTGPRWLSM